MVRVDFIIGTFHAVDLKLMALHNMYTWAGKVVN